MILFECTCRSININLVGNHGFARCNSCGRVDELVNFKITETKGSTHIDLDKSHWVNKDGDVVEIETMSIEYIKNVLKMLKRNYDIRELENSVIYKLLIDEWIRKEGI